MAKHIIFPHHSLPFKNKITAFCVYGIPFRLITINVKQEIIKLRE